RLAVIDPEAADRRIGVAERHVLLALRVREAGGVEIQPEPPLLRPVDPALEVLWPDLIAVDRAVGIQVDRVQVEALWPRDLGHRVRFFSGGMPGHDRVLSFPDADRAVRGPGSFVASGNGARANDWNRSETASGTASRGRNSSTAYDWRTRARASASELSTPRAISWLHAFPS